MIPSMPGYGFSEKPTTTGWNPERIADAYIELMERLGYTSYGRIRRRLGRDRCRPDGCQGATWPDRHSFEHGWRDPAGHRCGVLSRRADTQRSFRGRVARGDQLAYTYKHIGYAIMMGDRPQSLTGLTDSPVGLAAFMLDHDPKSYEMIARSIDGHPEGLTPDDVLDNITLFWLTNTAISCGAALLGKQVDLLRRQGRQHPGGGQRVSR